LDETTRTVDAHERRVPARDDQREVRERRYLGLRLIRIRQVHGREVTFEVVDADERLAGDPRERLRGLEPDEQGTDEPGGVRDRDAVDLVEVRTRAIERRL